MAVKSISELDTQATASDGDLFEVAVADSGSASGYSSKKESAAVIAEGIVNQYTYPLGMPHMQNKTILGAVNQLLANVAAVYDDTATYSAGDYRTYNGQLYKCNTDISTAETFDPTKWDAVTLADNLGSGGGGGGVSRTLLWSGDLTTVNSPVSLSEAITNFDQIQIVYSFNSNSDVYRKAAMYPIDIILIGTASNLQEGLYYQGSYNAFGSFSFPTSSSFEINERYVTGWGLHVLAIYGLN